MTGPRILLLDIENSAHKADVWQLYDANIPLNMLREPGHVMCFAAKWRGAKTVEFRSEFHDGHDEMIGRAWHLIDEADAVCHYNGNRHDIPHLNRAFFLADLGPPSPAKNIDLYQVVRNKFKFASNKLEHIAAQAGVGGKLSTGGYELWLKCLAGDVKAWQRMRRYCKQDVVLLEPLLDKLLPWITNFPAVGLWSGLEDSCRNCGGTELEKRGFARTAISTFQQYRCHACGAWSRGKKSIGTVNLRSAA